MTRKTLILCALLVACGDDTETTDGGSDATTDATTKDVANDNAVKDGATDAQGEAASDAGQDADATIDAPIDAIVDAPIEATTGCDGGCTKFSFECSNAQPACQCLGLANGQTGPVCDAAAANCFADPCLTKTVQCVNNACVVQ